jgi:F0F1-type ATP synthase membrane subunit c/vacuolar-type H+-ATPase subunit K
MTAPLISENVLVNISNHVHQRIQSDAYGNAWQKMRSGILVMQITLGIDNPGSIYDKMKKAWAKHSQNAVLKQEFKVKYFGLRFLEVLRIIALVFSLLYASQFLAAVEPAPSAVPIAIGLFTATVILFVASLVIRKNMKNKATDIINDKINSFSDSELVEFGSKKRIVYNSFMSSSDLKNICKALTIDPDDYEVDFEKHQGGGNTYVGWGSLGAIGAGLGMTAMSKVASANENLKANINLHNLEALCFYNNVAFYFNEHIDEIEKSFATV